MFSPRLNSLFTFFLLYTLIGVILMSIGGAVYFSRRNEARPPLDQDAARAAEVRRRANGWAVAGLLHLGFAYWAYDRATRACPLEPTPAERRAAVRTTRLALVTGAIGFLTAVGGALLVDLTPLLGQ